MEDSNGAFDEDTWEISPDGSTVTLYSGPALISQDQDVPVRESTEGWEQLVNAYRFKIPQDATFPEAEEGDIITVVQCERSPELINEKFEVQGEKHSGMRVVRTILAERRRDWR